jgi:alpha-glucosidase
VLHNLGPSSADGGGMARRLSLARTQTQRQVAPAAAPAPWWRDAVVYQVYLRSFADSDGDGIGDLRGLRQRLPYLSWLGVDAVWINPHYPSGGADGGYDVVDYRAVDPDYGDVSDLEALVDDARRLGLKVVLDVVPNHTSDQHPWFQAALADPDSPEAARYHFAPPSEEPPNNWQSLFGGPAWSRTPDGRWYLHLFAPEQPDLNWRDPAVAEDFERTLRFWLDRGVSGFRVDVAYGLYKDAGLRDNPGAYSPTLFGHGPEQAMTWNQPEVHDVWRRWRSICDEYPETMLVGEVCLADLEQVALYSRPDELHQSLSFRMLKSPWAVAPFAEAIASALDAYGQVGAPVSWVLGNHDKERQVTRFGGGEVGTARARAAALLTLALPGSAYLYAGDELGLPQAHVPDEAKQDPIFHRSGGARAGRDGCRVPMPWNPTDGVGFSPEGAAEPWLPIPADWGRYAVSVQTGQGGSTLTLHRRALALRKAHPAFASGSATVTTRDDVLTIRSVGGGEAVRCMVNMGSETVLAGCPGQVLLASTAAVRRSGGTVALPPDSAVWVLED